jgi:hypothetical protein
MKYYYIRFISGFLFVFIFLSGCNLYNPAEPVPSYIRINKIDLVTTSEQGTNSSKITDAWVYVDEELIGCFELPATIPVLFEGTHQVVIKAGIKVNGISATRAPYPFYERFVESTNLQRGTVVTMAPVVYYVSNLNWAAIWQENFEGAGISLSPSPFGTDTNMRKVTIMPGTTDPYVFEGMGSGVANVPVLAPKFENVSDMFVLPRGDSPSFLELNYKCNYQVVVGLVANTSTGLTRYKVINLNTSPEWNKIYIYLNPVITATGGATGYSVFLGMLNTSTVNDPFLAVDNIKLLHY